MHSLNLSTFAYINNAAGVWPILDWSVLLVTNELTYVVCILVALYITLWYPLRHSQGVGEMLRAFRQARVFVVAVVSTWIVVSVVKLMVALPRPFMTLHTVNILSPFEKGYSFPSLHTALTIAIATVVYLYHRRLGTLLYFFGVLVGISRVYVGVHYPSDVVVGALLGFLIAALVYIGMPVHIGPQRLVAAKPKKA